jgi:uncharacterized membrane protein YqgA involved in biofilm formation
MLGTFVNTGAVIVGSLFGLLLKKGIPEKIGETVMKALARCVLFVGLSGAFQGTNALIMILSMVVGTVIGQLLMLDERLGKLGDLIGSKFKTSDGGGRISEGFVTASLLFCVGSMAIVGSIQSGLTGNHEMLFTKSLLDGISSVVFASTLGFGVLLSAACVFVYQGAITLLAHWVAPYLSDYAVAEMTCVGSRLIIALGLNMLGVTKIKVMNMIPAVLLPVAFCLFM